MSENLGLQVVMRRAVAARRRFLLCQKLGVVRTLCPASAIPDKKALFLDLYSSLRTDMTRKLNF